MFIVCGIFVCLWVHGACVNVFTVVVVVVVIVVAVGIMGVGVYIPPPHIYI